MNKDCAVLILSCDKNEGLLNIFFDFYKKNWPDCPYETYLGIEKKNITYEGIISLKSNRKPWASRVLDYLNSISAGYVLIILDDFILEEKAETEEIVKYHEYMKANDRIVTISLADIYDKNNYDCEYKGLVRRTKKANYLLNMQVGIWNKEILKELMRENESPWQTELYGSIRARKLEDYFFLCLRSDADSPYKYGRGLLMVRGAWTGKEIKRLGLEKFSDDIFDGKDIIYSEFSSLGLVERIIRRLNILYRQILSNFKIYI